MSKLLNRNLATVGTWYQTPSESALNALQYAFETCELFSNIWIPVREVNSDGMRADAVYQNIGITPFNLSLLYQTLYTNNYLISNFEIRNNVVSLASISDLRRRILSVYMLNRGKYLKLIELAGYLYNPLWNVDGTEDYTYLENSGTNDVTTTHQYDSYTDNGTNNIGAQTDQTTDRNTRSGGETRGKTEKHNDTNSVTSFDSTELNTTSHNDGEIITSNDQLTYNNVIDDASGSITHGSRNDTSSTTHGAHTDTDGTTITHHNALNGQADYSGDTDTFGNRVIGGDKYHTERRVRAGNIGVTRTQDLIAAERENLKFNIIFEFFKDINQQILVGIYN